MKFWYIRGRRGFERGKYRHEVLREVFPDFQLLHRPGLEGVRRHGWRCDVMFIGGRVAAKQVHRLGLENRASFMVYVPSWRRGGCGEELRTIKRIKPHLVCPDQTMYLDEFLKVHDRVHYVGRGFDPKVFYPSDEKKYDIVFCGNLKAYGRQKRLDLLSEKFDVHTRHGIGHAEMARFLRHGKIGWNQIMRPEHGVGINYRVLEVMGSRLLHLCNRTTDIERIFVDGVHCVLYDSDEDMVEKTGYYLEHDAEREEIALGGYEEALSKHTWVHRAMEYKELIERYI